MKKRIFSLFLALAMCLTLLPDAALAADSDNNVLDLRSASENKIGSGYSWDSTTKTLTLTSFNFGGDIILPNDGATVVISGTASVNNLYVTGGAYTIQGKETLNISGYITGHNETSPSFSLTIDGTTVNAANVNNGNTGFDQDILTLTNGAVLNAESISWTASGGISLKNGCSLIVKSTEEYSGSIFTNRFTMEGDSYVYSQGGLSGYSSADYSGIMSYLPDGYTIGGSGDKYIAYADGVKAAPLELQERKTSTLFEIYNPTTLKQFVEMVKENPAVCGTVTASFSMEGESWTPMGTKNAPYTGTLYGNGYTISNFRVSSSSSGGYVGLFGCIGEGGTVQNVKLKSVSISASGKTGYAGAICGYNNGGTITNCTVTGTVSTCGQSGSSGGVCGYNAGTITGCTSSVKVTASGKSAYAGGISGYNAKAGTLTSCSSSGAVTTSGKSGKAGGICGYNAGKIASCSSTGKIRATGQSGKSGKICGYNSGKVS